MAQPKKQTAELQISPLSLIRMIWKRKTLIVSLALAISTAAGVVIWRLPAIYTSEALILVDSQKIPEKFVASTVSTSLQDRLSAINQRILSTDTLKKIIDDFDLYRNERSTHVQEEIFDMMRKDISVKVEKGWSGNQPGAFRVGYEGSKPYIVAQVANRLADAYVEENLRVREVQAEGTSEFIDVQLQEARARLDKLEAAVSEYKLKHNGELPQQENTISASLARLQVELQANADQLNRDEQSKVMLESTLNVADASLASMPRLPDGDSASPASPMEAADGPRASDKLEQELAMLKLKYTPEHPDVRALEAQVAKMKALEAGERKTVSTPAGIKPQLAHSSRPESEAVRQIRQRITATKTQLGLTTQDIEKRKADQQRIVEAIRGYEEKLQHLPVREQEMASVTRDYEIARANYKSLLDKKIAAEMSTDMERRQKSERFAILDRAPVPEKPIKPNRPLFAGVAVALAFGISLVLGVVIEFKNGCILGEWELPNGVPVLGRLPFIDEDTDKVIDAPRGWRSLFRRKRTRIATACACLLVSAATAAAYVFRGKLGI